MPVCPHCKEPNPQFRIDGAELHDYSSTPIKSYMGVSYSCTECNKIVSVSPNIDIMLQELCKALKKQ